MTRSETIRRLLREGPATSNEMVDTLHINPRTIHIDLQYLCWLGHVERLGTIPSAGRPRRIYALTPRGAARIKFNKALRG